jgi:dTDP-4-amino-4,6-dideoxygalactose transaminase
MLRFGQKEIDAFAAAVKSGKLFRYAKGGACQRFEHRYARHLGVPHVLLTSSGTTALQAALVGLGIGPGDEVIVPACTYMATALAVLGAGAIPVIVDIDESVMLDPDAVAEAIGPRTRAVVPVHMWGQVCDMGAIMRLARRRKLLVVEDACQCVGGAWGDRMVGSIGDAGAMSFNFYKNMCCGEGGAVVSRHAKAMERAACMIDSCSFYWTGRRRDFRPFAAVGSRASDFEGAIMNAQLDRLPAMIRALRRIKQRVLTATADLDLGEVPRHSPDGECATTVMYRFPTAEAADTFATAAGGTVCIRTGRHVYSEWDPILSRQGAHHPALDPFRLPANRGCRMNYSKDMCPRTLDILSRTVMFGLHPDMKTAQVKALVARIVGAAR